MDAAINVVEQVAAKVRESGSPQAVRDFLNVAKANKSLRKIAETGPYLQELNDDIERLRNIPKLGEQVHDLILGDDDLRERLEGAAWTFRLLPEAKKDAFVNDVAQGDGVHVAIMARDPNYSKYLSDKNIRSLTEASVHLFSRNMTAPHHTMSIHEFTASAAAVNALHNRMDANQQSAVAKIKDENPENNKLIQDLDSLVRTEGLAGYRDPGSVRDPKQIGELIESEKTSRNSTTTARLAALGRDISETHDNPHRALQRSRDDSGRG
jgi:hypothetical protein